MRTFAITTLLMITVPSFAGLNIALNKPATANEEHTRGAASYAVDGDYDSMWNAGRIADPSNPAWLKIDLGDIYAVSEIVLWTDTHDDFYGYYIDLDSHKFILGRFLGRAVVLAFFLFLLN